MRRSSRFRRCWVLLPALAALLMVQAMQAAAQDIGYFGTNRLLFEPVGILSPPDSIGRGVIDYQGGDDPNSQWRATVRFSGLRANAGFVVMLKGRYGDNGSDDARALTPLCSFQTNDAGRGGCFWYFQGLARLNVAQLRTDDSDGIRLLQASRDGDPGSIVTNPNRYSPGGEVPARKATKPGKPAT